MIYIIVMIIKEIRKKKNLYILYLYIWSLMYIVFIYLLKEGFIFKI